MLLVGKCMVRESWDREEDKNKECRKRHITKCGTTNPRSRKRPQFNCLYKSNALSTGSPSHTGSNGQAVR